MFGMIFPVKFRITEHKKKECKFQAIEFKKYWQPSEKYFYKGLLKIYSKAKIPSRLICYLNSSPYSMDDFEKGCISVSYKFKTPDKVKRVVAHELAHFLFRQAYTKYSLKVGYSETQLEDLKEILTVLHKPVLGLDDKGYKVHAKQRTQALKLWSKYHNLEKVISGLFKNKI